MKHNISIRLTDFIYRLCGIEMEFSASLSGALTAVRHDEEARLNKKVEKVREEEKVTVVKYGLTTFEVHTLQVATHTCVVQV